MELEKQQPMTCLSQRLSGPIKAVFNLPLQRNPQHMGEGAGPCMTGWDSKGGNGYDPFEVTKAGKM